MKNPFWAAALWLYQKFYSFFKKRQSPVTFQTLCRLHPLESGEKLYGEYQVKKLTVVLSILAAGMMALLAFGIYSESCGGAIPDGKLARKEWNQGAYSITLQAQVEELVKEIAFTVKAREPTGEEKNRMRREFEALLEERLKKDNVDLLHVTGNLELISSAEGYPFSVVWFSRDRELVDQRGTVNRQMAGEEGAFAKLTAVVSDEEQSYRLEYEVFVLPETLSQEQLMERAIESYLLEADEKSKNESSLLLPQQIKGQAVEWAREGPDGIWLIAALSLAAMLLVGRGMDRDLEKDCKKRGELLRTDYVEFVSKLRLYLSAGLTLKNIFLKLGEDYGAAGGKGKRKYLYEEILVSCNQLRNGVMEEKVYQDWGKRCGEMKYRRLSFLLSIYLKHGSDRLLTILSQEADRAQEDRRNLARKAGEEAGTKLLLPMMLMLLVVICLVLLPAYLDFGAMK